MFARFIFLFAILSASLFADKQLTAIAKKEKLNRTHLLETARYIDTHTFTKKKTYLPKEETGLAYDLEYDANYKNVFIILEGKRHFIGEGKKKTVRKAIHYHKKNPQIVARAEDPTTESRERLLTQKLHGAPGIFQTVGFGQNTKKGKKYSTIYSKLYNPGQLHNALEKGYNFTLKEKIKIAYDILQGLHSLHSRGIVHRDLGARNYLIDIPKGKPGKRAISAAIADLGRANYAKYAADTKVQGNTTYTAPEAIYRSILNGKAYYKTDTFAVGCVLYWLFYEKQGKWQDFSYVKSVHMPLYHRYMDLKSRVEKATKKRRTQLAKRSKKTVKDKFELLILRMLHTDPTKRATAEESLQAIKKLHRNTSTL